MFFLRNIFFLFYIGFKKKNSTKMTFKENYKLYLFFKKHEVYFLRLFFFFKIGNVTPFFYFNFLQHVLKKNFEHQKFWVKRPWFKEKCLLFFICYFLNKTYRIKVNKNRFKKKNWWGRRRAPWSKYKIDLKTNKFLFPVYFWSYRKYVSDAINLEKKQRREDASKQPQKHLVNYSGTSLGKYVNKGSLNNMTFYFLRKTKMFNKGRYSRNRQNYRTGVYWCLYINIMVLFGLYLYFYRFTLNFGYLWWLFFSLVASFFVPRILKFRLNNPWVFLKAAPQSQPLFFFLFK